MGTYIGTIKIVKTIILKAAFYQMETSITILESTTAAGISIYS